MTFGFSQRFIDFLIGILKVIIPTRARSLEKETDSPFEKIKLEENHKRRMKDGSPHGLNRYKRRCGSRKLDLSDEKYFGGNKESGSSSERSCDR